MTTNVHETTSPWRMAAAMRLRRLTDRALRRLEQQSQARRQPVALPQSKAQAKRLADAATARHLAAKRTRRRQRRAKRSMPDELAQAVARFDHR